VDKAGRNLAAARFETREMKLRHRHAVEPKHPDPELSPGNSSIGH
jgi:hypothetical protein